MHVGMARTARRPSWCLSTFVRQSSRAWSAGIFLFAVYAIRHVRRELLVTRLQTWKSSRISGSVPLGRTSRYGRSEIRRLGFCGDSLRCRPYKTITETSSGKWNGFGGFESINSAPDEGKNVHPTPPLVHIGISHRIWFILQHV